MTSHLSDERDANQSNDESKKFKNLISINSKSRLLLEWRFEIWTSLDLNGQKEVGLKKVWISNVI